MKQINVKVLDNIDTIRQKLNKNKFIVRNYLYDIKIYLVKKDFDILKVNSIYDLKNYAIVEDNNTDKSVIIYENKTLSSKISNLNVMVDILKELGYKELLYINKDIYKFEKGELSFEVYDVLNHGVFLSINSSENADKIFIVAAAGATIEDFAREIMYSKEQQEDVVGEFNGVQINAEDFSSEQEIVDRLSSALDNKIADGNSENANATLVDLDDKKVLVTDKMIENAILNAAANRKKSISEFTLEESNFKEITSQLEFEIFKKEDVSADKKDKLSKAVEKRVELVKTKMVVSEVTTDSFREIISERGITDAGDLSVSEVESRVSDKLEEWVKVKPNATASVLDNIAKQRQALDGSSVSDSKKLAQPALGGKTIEEITSSAVQARHQALTNLNKKGAGSSISEETTKKLKESLEERHRKEFQQFLIDVTQEQDDKRLAELLASVPEEQAEAAFCVLDVQRYNLEANRVKQKGAKAKHLTFDMDSSGVLESLNSMKSSEEVKTGDRRVENSYDSSVGEQDTRVKETGDISDASRENLRRSTLNQSDLMTSRKRSGIITSKEINSGIDRPLRDLASLIDSIGKNR